MPQSKVAVDIFSHAVHYGTGVFEGARSYGGRIFKLQEHAERLMRSAAILGINYQNSVEEICKACESIVKANGNDTCYVRPLIWLGEGSVLGIDSRGSTIHSAILTWDMGKYFANGAVSLRTSRWRRPHPDSAPVFAKATGLYILSTMAKQEAKSHGFDDALLLNIQGHIAESTGANIFLIIDDALHTPTPDCFLNGITRQEVIRLAQAGGVEVIERSIPVSDLERAQGVFLTGSAAELTPVSRIDEHVYQTHQLCEQLAQAYRDQTRA